MKIVAYSKVPTSTPYVHLGYLAAAAANPIPALLWGGIVIVIAAVLSKPLLSIAGRRSLRGKSPESVQTSGLPAHKLRVIEWTLFLLGITAVISAFAFGERVYAAPARLTRMLMITWGSHLRSSEPNSNAEIVASLPTQEGQYDLRSVLSVPGRSAQAYADGWKTPLMLRVAQDEGQLKYTVMSAGPDRAWRTQDDITGPDILIKP